MKAFGWLMALLGLLTVLSVGSAQTTHEVDLIIEEVEGRPIPEFCFQPVGLFIEVGDTVRFNAVTPHHTVTAYHPQQGKPQRVPEGVEPFSSPVIPVGESWEYTFTVPGIYDVWCAPHENYGMAMRVVVGEASGPAAEASDDFSPGGTYGAAGMVLNDPALDPQRIIDAGSVLWDEISDEAKAMPEAPAGEAAH